MNDSHTLSPTRLGALLATGAGALALAIALPASAAPATAVMAVDSTFTTFDPYDANDTLSQAVAKSFYEGLFGFDKDLKLENVLATGYTASPDARVYTITLRHGVKFQDGTDFDAAAVKANFDRVTDAANHLKRYAMFNRIEKTSIVSPDTVQVTLKEPFSAFINVLAHPSAVMISPAAMKKWGREIGLHPVGTGPFELVAWNQTGDVTVKKFDGYWKKGYPKIDAIDWKPVSDNNTRAALMKTGEADFAFRIPYEQAAALKANSKVDVVERSSIIERYISMNMLHKPFDNPKVREALNYAINRDALIKVAYGGFAKPADGIVPPGIDYSVKIGTWKYDPAKARALLSEAGYPNGFETILWSAYANSTSQKVLQFVQQQLAQVGVKVQVQALEAGEGVAKVESAQDPDKAPVRMYYSGWSASTGEANWALSPLLASSSMPPKMMNTAYYKNAQVDDDLAQALKTTVRERKSALYTDAQQRIWADMPWIPLVQESIVYAHSKRLHGAYVMPDGSFNFTDISVD